MQFQEDFSVEYQKAKSEISKSSPIQILPKFYNRLDTLMLRETREATDKLACGKGCSYCCYYKVEVRAVEILKIAQYVKAKFSPEKIQVIINNASANVEEAKTLTYEQHLATNQKCPFLEENCCSIYEVRPSKCRSFHATDVDLCKQSYDEPQKVDIPNGYIQSLRSSANNATYGFEEAVKYYGYDSRLYDMNSALVEAFHNNSLIKRYNDKKKAFLQARQIELPE